MESGQIKATILEHAEFKAYAGRVAEVFDGWRQAHTATLKELQAGCKPKEVIHTLAEELLVRFARVPLLDRYDVYQRLMDYWDEVMQDDVDLIATDGWEAGRILRDAYEKETPDFSVKKGKKTFRYVGELIPAALLIARFFKSEQSKLEQLEADVTDATNKREEFEEAHTGDEGVLNGLEGKKGIPKTNVQDRVSAVKDMILAAFPADSPEYKQAKTIKKTSFDSTSWKKGINDKEGLFEELDILYDYLQIVNDESNKKAEYKKTLDSLHKALIQKYPKLIEDEIKSLVVDDKWFTAVQSAVDDQLQRMTQRLSGRVKELGRTLRGSFTKS